MERNNNELFDISTLNMSEKDLFSSVDISNVESEKITAPRYSYWKSVFRVFFKKKINYFILGLLALVLLFTYIYPIIFPYDLMENYHLGAAVKHLSPAGAIDYLKNQYGTDWFSHYDIRWILGTGSQGEFTFSSTWAGARISLSLAFICAAINMIIGIVLGAVWGFSKKVDLIMTEVYNIIGNVPYILIISVLILILSPSFMTMVFALTITGWIGIAYFIRTQVIIIRDREYNLASRCLGTPTFRLVTKNILPFMTSVIVTLLATELPSYISYEVFLSYIGIGISGASSASLGNLIYTNESSMLIKAWQTEFWAPVSISAIITIVLYVVGQNLGDASDPRTHM